MTVRVDRLTILADFMDKLPPEANKHFNMHKFFIHIGKHPIPEDKIAEALSNFDCGTSACALGFACTIPAFRKEGLKFIKANSITPDTIRSLGYITYKNNYNFTAAMVFFGLSARDAEHLFGLHTNIATPKQWAKRCRKYIKEIS